ncbi:hypothetical protein LSTR_LSTR000036 [Laodelphax striatellus]|uniref:Uncharacterized protein n=1 Tax=Laodelphax striatellus TaxID=195883 RepID=A0A482X6L5_LAOST|nr:hypothetical protein LSTR_LSTR000036 [Laodelphax striatellus]
MKGRGPISTKAVVERDLCCATTTCKTRNLRVGEWDEQGPTDNMELENQRKRKKKEKRETEISDGVREGERAREEAGADISRLLVLQGVEDLDQVVCTDVNAIPEEVSVQHDDANRAPPGGGSGSFHKKTCVLDDRSLVCQPPNRTFTSSAATLVPGQTTRANL